MRIAAEFFNASFTGSTSDFESAYRQVTAVPEQARPFVVAMWDPIAKRVVLGIAVSRLFGSGPAPLNLLRFPAWCVHALGMAFGVLADHCVYDNLSIGALRSGWSPFSCWRSFAGMCSWNISDKKETPAYSGVPFARRAY